MNPLRFVVLGSGSIANSHVANLTALAAVQPVGFHDVSDKALERWTQRFPDAVITTDADRLLAETKPDLACVCSPNVAHASLTRTALRHGAHVMCEKPMAMNVAEAEAMELARREANRLGAINFSYRCVSAFQLARSLVADGELGRIQRLNVVYLQSFLGAEETPFSWRNDASVAGFGALGDLGAHMIDGATFISGMQPKRAIGVAQTLVPHKLDTAGQPQKVTTDTNASFLIEYDTGAIGTFETSQTTPGYGNHFRIEISGDRGMLRVCSEESDSLVLISGRRLTRYTTWKTDAPRVRVPTGFAATQPRNNLEAFVRAIRGESIHYPEFADGLSVQRCLDAIVTSTRTRAWVEL